VIDEFEGDLSREIEAEWIDNRKKKKKHKRKAIFAMIFLK